MEHLTTADLAELNGGTDMWDFACGLLAFGAAGAFFKFGPMAAFYVGSAAYGVCLVALAGA